MILFPLCEQKKIVLCISHDIYVIVIQKENHMRVRDSIKKLLLLARKKK